MLEARARGFFAGRVEGLDFRGALLELRLLLDFIPSALKEYSVTPDLSAIILTILLCILQGFWAKFQVK